MSNLIPSQTRDALAWWREHEHFLIWGTLIISGVAAVGLAVSFVHAVRIGAPLGGEGAGRGCVRACSTHWRPARGEGSGGEVSPGCGGSGDLRALRPKKEFERKRR